MTHPAFPIELNAELIDAYAQDGFVKTENVLSDAELRNYSDAVDREVAARTASDTRAVAEKPPTSRALFSACVCGKPAQMCGTYRVTQGWQASLLS